MTKSEAYQSMLDGNKITHPYFGESEFLEIKDGKLVDECGYSMFEYWKSRTESWSQQDWEVKK